MLLQLTVLIYSYCRAKQQIAAQTARRTSFVSV